MALNPSKSSNLEQLALKELIHREVAWIQWRVWPLWARDTAMSAQQFVLCIPKCDACLVMKNNYNDGQKLKTI